MTGKTTKAVLTTLFAALFVLQIVQWSRVQLPLFAPLALLGAAGLAAGLMPVLKPLMNRVMFVSAYGSAFLLIWAAGQPQSQMPVGRVWGLSALICLAVVCLISWATHKRTGNRWLWAFVAAIGFGLLIAFISGPEGGPDWMVVFVTEFFQLDDWRDAKAIVYTFRKSMHLLGYGLAAYCTAWAVFRQKGGRTLALVAGLAWPLPLAIFDEWQQTQASNRSGQIADIVIDLAGMVTFLALFWWRSGIKSRQEVSSDA